MTVATSAQTALAELRRALERPGTDDLERVVLPLERDHPGQPFTLYGRAEIARRRGDARGALVPSTAALAMMLGKGVANPDGTLPLPRVLASLVARPPAHLTALLPYATQFGSVAERSGMLRGMGEGLARLVSPLLAREAQAHLTELHAQLVLALFGFHVEADEAWATTVFEGLVLPWMEASAAEGRFETALQLEALAYNAHVKRRESQEWFKRTAGRWMGPLAEHSRKARGRFAPPHERWRPENVRRIGFFVHNASMLAHVMVLIETLEAVRNVGPRNYEFTVFVLGGRHPRMREKLTACGVQVRYLDEHVKSSHGRLLELQRILREENFLGVIWTSLVTLMAMAFPQRIAPLQVWWAMKYHAGDMAEIDARMGLENVVLSKRLEGYEWRTIGNSSARWIVPGRDAEAAALRATWPADRVVAACVGREEKLDSPEFLRAVSTLLQRHPEMLFVWTGRNRRASIQSHFEREGVADRTHFAGWVDTKLYAQAVDVFLDSFPFPCGFSLKEAMAAGKPAVMMRTHESLETGVPGALSPVARGETRLAPEVDAKLRGIFTDRAEFDLYLCAEAPEGYVEMASRVISDPAWRARVGAANRAYIEAFVSSPEAEAVKFLDHLDALCAPLANP